MKTVASTRKTGFPGILILFLLLGFSSFLPAAISMVRGYIKDTAGVPLAGVRLFLVSAGNSSVKFELETDESGYFVKNGLTDGMYRLTVEREGFLPVQTTIWLKPGDLYEADFKLEVLKPGLSETSAGSIVTSNKLMRAGKYDEAVEKLNQAIEAEPGSFILYYYRARIYEKKSDSDRAIEDFKKSLQMKPDFLLALSALGLRYARREEFSEAVYYFKKAFDLNLTDTFSLYNYGACLIHRGSVPEARRVFERVVQLESGYAEAYFQLGMIHLGMNDNARARECLGIFVRLEPGNRNAAVARDILRTLK
jgi:tetratricopeptide (TPR) repeat protein